LSANGLERLISGDLDLGSGLACFDTARLNSGWSIDSKSLSTSIPLDGISVCRSKC